MLECLGGPLRVEEHLDEVLPQDQISGVRRNGGAQALDQRRRHSLFLSVGAIFPICASGTQAMAVGQLKTDEHLNTGKVDGVFARTFPREIAPSQETIERGQERFGIYCAPCHGYSGAGDGMVHKRAAALQEAGVAGSWVPPSNLQQQTLYEQPVGQLFDSITNGVRNMPGYGHSVSTEDRWAIVMYLRALQRMRVASLGDLTPEERRALK